MSKLWVGCLCLCLLFAGQFFAGPFADAAQVSKVRGKSLLLQLDGDSVKPGEICFLVDMNGKKRAIIKIFKVRGDRAIARVGRGRASVGMTLLKINHHASQAASPPPGESPREAEAYPVGYLTHKMYWGGQLGYAMDTMNVDINSPTFTGTVGMKGNALSYKGLFDYRVFKQIWFRGTAGLQSFKGTGNSNCGTAGTTQCNADINYLSFDFLGRYLFLNGRFRPWAGGGFSLLFPMSKTATALEASSITSTSLIEVAAGFDYSINPRMYVPFSIEYGMLPKSNDVDASWIAIRLGLAVPF